MISLKQINKRVASVLGTALIFSGIALPAAFPVMASALALNSRSITMSSSAPGATGVSYDLNATVSTTIPVGGGVVVEFCDDSPLVGLSCHHPTGLDVSNVTLATGTDPVSSNTYSSGTATGSGAVLKWTATDNAVSTNLTIGFQNITNPTSIGETNPTDTGTYYARVTTYTDMSASTGKYTDAQDVGDTLDSGGVALATTQKIGITAYVQESLTFCVSKTKPGPSCAGADDPSWTLGQETSAGSGVFVLNTSTVSTGKDWAQLGTNAAHGAVVNLQSDATGCGGLIRANDGTNCDITPATTQTTATNMAGAAKFGLIVGPDQDATGDSSSIGGLTKATAYSNADYFMDYHSGDTTGVTSTYGSPLFDSTDPNNSAAGPAPVANRNMPFTFGASAAPATPAGIYSANITLVATGTF